jgi:5-(carboxyamino)imidazole ribonucleotide synthase
MKVPKKVGILGGGQLARMLILEGHRLGLEMHVLCTSKNEPAAQVTSHVHIGTIDSLDDLNKFFKDLDAVTFESEFVDIGRITQSAFSDIHFFPNMQAIELVQDRLTQKQLLDDHDIPTAAWLPVASNDDLRKAATKFKKGFVLKKRRFGYDGYGTYMIKKVSPQHEKLLLETPAGFIAEEIIPFIRELATTAVRSKSQLQFLPLVETKQVDSRCLWVRGPLSDKALTPLKKNITRLLGGLNYTGAIAFELFETKKGLLVNEIAPRVHNSAHYSLDGLNLSQFEYHLRAGLNWQLPPPASIAKGFAMVNLLGEGNGQVKLSDIGAGKLHWYGKSDNRKGRKLGHITCLGATSDKALASALKWRKDFIL